MIQIGKYNPIFFAPRKYRYGTGEYVQRFDLSDTVRFELLSGKGETAAVRLNNLSTGESQPLLPQTFSVSDETDAHVYSVQPGEGFFSVTVGDTSSVESEPFRICSCSECTSLMEYSNADNDADGGAFVNGDEKITFMFRFEGGIKPVDTEHRCENESFRDQRQRIHNLYSAAYEVLKLTVGDTSTGCPEWYAGFFNRVLCLSDVKINGESLARSEGSTPEKTQMQEGSSLVYFTINLEAEGTSSAGGGGNFNPGGGGGFSVYIITTDDLTAASDANLFSSLRTLREIEGRSLSKQHEDTTNYLLNLLGGIISPFLTSPDFISGALGTGFTVQRNADGTTYAEVDRLFVRAKAVFQMLEILKADVAGGEIVINSGPRMKVTRVERTGNVPAYFSAGQAAYFTGGERAYFASSYRLWFLADDGDTAVQNLFHVGDLARCQTFDIKAGVYENVSNRFWWRLVTAVGDDWIEVSSTVCAEGSDVPKEGDTVVQMGSDRDTDRQALIVLSAYGQGAPSLTMYQGIDSFSLSGKGVFSVGYDPVKKECFFNSYGRAYIGDRNGRYYIRYSHSEGLEIKARRYLLESGDELSDTLSRIEQDARKISLSVTEVRNGLERTGIDIEEGKVTVTADSFFVNSTAGTPIAVFTVGEDGRPLIKAEYIDADNLYVKHLEGATGSIGSLEISAESTAGNIPGIYYEYDNTVLKMQPRWMSAMPYNVFLLRPSSDSMNVELYLKRRRSNIYDRALYVDGVAEVYGRLGVGRGPDTGFKSGLPALVAEGISVYGQLCLSTKTVGSSQSLGADSSFIIASTGGIELTLPDSDVSDGQIYYILNSYEGSEYNTLYGRIISGGTTIPRTRMSSGTLYMAVYLYNRSLWFVKEL